MNIIFQSLSQPDAKTAPRHLAVEVGMLPVRNAKFVVRKQWIVAACDDMCLAGFGNRSGSYGAVHSEKWNRMCH